MSFIQPSFYNAAITLSLCVATLSNAQDIIYNIDVLNYEWVTNPIDPNNNSDNLTIERESAGTWTSSLPLGIGNSGISGQSAISLQIDDGELTIDHGISHHMASGNTLPTFSSVFTEVGVRAWAPVGTEVSIRLAQGSQTINPTPSGSIDVNFPAPFDRSVTAVLNEDAIRFNNVDYGLVLDLTGDTAIRAESYNSDFSGGGTNVFSSSLQIFAEPPSLCNEGNIVTTNLVEYLDHIGSYVKLFPPPMSIFTDVDLRLNSTDVPFLISDPGNLPPGSLCEAVGDGQRTIDLLYNHAGFTGEQAVGNMEGSVTLTRLSADAAPSAPLCTPMSGANGCYLNPRTPGGEVVEWRTGNFRTEQLAFGLPVGTENTGPMSVYVDLSHLESLTGVDLGSDVPFSDIIDPVEQFIEDENISIVYLPNAEQNPWRKFLSVIDPSSAEMMITDPRGRRLGKNAGEFDELAGAYFDFGPSLFIPSPIAGEYSVTLRGIEPGEYLVTIYLDDETGVSQEFSFSGFLGIGETATHEFTIVPEPTSPAMLFVVLFLSTVAYRARYRGPNV